MNILFAVVDENLLRRRTWSKEGPYNLEFCCVACLVEKCAMKWLKKASLGGKKKSRRRKA